MILDSAAALTRLNSKDNLCNKFKEFSESNPGNSIVREVKDGKMVHHEGGKTEKPNLDEIERKLIAGLAIQSNQQDVASAFNLSYQAVSKLANGKVTSGSEQDPRLAQMIESTKDKLAADALSTAMDAFGLMPSKLGEAKARDLASIAKDSVIVYDKLKGQGQNNGVQVVIYTTPEKRVSDYEVVDAERIS